jgi:hypothetical protein
LNGKRAQRRKANIQETLAEASEPIFSLSFPNPGGKAVAGHALASPGIPLSCKKELIVGAKARRIYFNFTSFPPIVKKNRVPLQFRKEIDGFARSRHSGETRVQIICDRLKVTGSGVRPGPDPGPPE